MPRHLVAAIVSVAATGVLAQQPTAAANAAGVSVAPRCAAQPARRHRRAAGRHQAIVARRCRADPARCAGRAVRPHADRAAAFDLPRRSCRSRRMSCATLAIRSLLKRSARSCRRRRSRRRRRELEKRVSDAQQSVQDRRRSLDQGFNTAMQKVNDAMVQVVTEIVQERQYQIVMTKAQVVIVQTHLDITAEVLRRLNRKLPSVAVSIPQNLTDGGRPVLSDERSAHAFAIGRDRGCDHRSRRRRFAPVRRRCRAGVRRAVGCQLSRQPEVHSRPRIVAGRGLPAAAGARRPRPAGHGAVG